MKAKNPDLNDMNQSMGLLEMLEQHGVQIKDPAQDYYKFWGNPQVGGKYPDDQKKTYIPVQKPVYNDDAIQAQIAMIKAGQYGKPKSAFEEMINLIFSLVEKEQFLIDAGYMIAKAGPDYRGVGDTIITRTLADGTVKTITNTLDDLFLKEITIKFKNLLLAKSTLKLKL